MNIIVSAKLYFKEILKISGQGMKALVMDRETLTTTSLIFPQSELLESEIYIFEKIDALCPDSLSFVNSIFFIRPTEENILLLCKELQTPRYGSYFLFFSNKLSTENLNLIAKSDSFSSIKELHEFFWDFYPLSPYLFSTNQNPCRNKNGWLPKCLDRCAHALLSVVLSLRLNVQIRYQPGSTDCQALATSTNKLLQEINKNDKLNYNQRPNSCLLIIDRRHDTITPLIFHLTYQTMVHELLTITNNIVKLDHIPNISSELKEVVLSSEHDKIFQTNMFSEFSDVARNIKNLFSEYESIRKDKQKLDSLEDIKAVIDSYPKFKKVSSAVSKHLTLASELGKMVQDRNLASQNHFEQNLFGGTKSSSLLFNDLVTLIRESSTTSHDAIRLSLLFRLLQNESFVTNKEKLIRELKQKSLPEARISLLDLITSYSLSQGGTSQVKNYFKNILQMNSLQSYQKSGVEELVTSLIKSQQSILKFSAIGSSSETFYGYDQIIIFIVGGTTYEESRVIHEINKSSSGLKFLLGGTTVHNSASYLQEVMDTS